jgi:hypothetical protein
LLGDQDKGPFVIKDDGIANAEFATAAIFVGPINEGLVGGKVPLGKSALIDDVNEFQKLSQGDVIALERDFLAASLV